MSFIATLVMVSCKSYTQSKLKGLSLLYMQKKTFFYTMHFYCDLLNNYVPKEIRNEKNKRLNALCFSTGEAKLHGHFLKRTSKVYQTSQHCNTHSGNCEKCTYTF